MKLRGADGSVPRTAVALVLGLVSTVAACGDDTGTGGNAEGGFAADYGVPGTGGMVLDGGGPAGGGGAGQGGDAGGGGAGAEGGFAADYGVPGTGGFGGAQ
jgi:hypothetical protein